MTTDPPPESRSRVLIVTATSILAESGTVSRLRAALRAITTITGGRVDLIGFESRRLLQDKALVRNRIQWLKDEGINGEFFPTIPQRLPYGRRINSYAAGLRIRKKMRSAQYTAVSALNSDAASACAAAGIAESVIRIFDMHGVESEEEILAGTAERGDRRFRNRIWCETRGIKWADIVIAASPAAEDWGRGLVANNTARWFDLPTLCTLEVPGDEIPEMRRAARAALGWEQCSVVVYAGGFSGWQQPELMMDVVSRACKIDESVRFLVLTMNIDEGLALAKQYGIADRVVVKSVPHNEIAEHGVAGDAGLLLRDNSVVNQVASPTKFSEYLEMGMPALITDVLAGFSVTVRENGVGRICGADWPAEQFAKELVGLLAESRSSRPEMTSKCREAGRESYRFPRALALYEKILNHTEQDSASAAVTV